MPRQGAVTKEKILDTAQELVLKYGFSATTLDLLIEAVGITKGAFFYHFKSKADLGKQLLQRFAKQHVGFVHGLMTRAEKLSRDPLQQFLIFIGLFEEVAPAAVRSQCLIASYCYESGLFEEEVNGVCSGGLTDSAEIIEVKIGEILKTRKPAYPIDPKTLANHFIAVYEGALILAKLQRNPEILPLHLAHYKQGVELLFGGLGPS